MINVSQHVVHLHSYIRICSCQPDASPSRPSHRIPRPSSQARPYIPSPSRLRIQGIIRFRHASPSDIRKSKYSEAEFALYCSLGASPICSLLLLCTISPSDVSPKQLYFRRVRPLRWSHSSGRLSPNSAFPWRISVVPAWQIRTPPSPEAMMYVNRAPPPQPQPPPR